jgi:hypothetical protein
MNFTKLKIIYFQTVEEQNLGQFSKNYRTFYPKKCHQALKNMGLGSGIREKPIPVPRPRVKKAPDPRSATLLL